MRSGSTGVDGVPVLENPRYAEDPGVRCRKIKTDDYFITIMTTSEQYRCLSENLERKIRTREIRSLPTFEEAAAETLQKAAADLNKLLKRSGRTTGHKPG